MNLRSVINSDGLIIDDNQIASEATLLLIQNILEDMSTDVTTTVEIPSKSTVSTSGTVLAGTKSVTFITSSDFVGTILGNTSQADAVYTFSASLGNTLSTIAYTVSAGNIEIMEVR